MTGLKRYIDKAVRREIRRCFHDGDIEQAEAIGQEIRRSAFKAYVQIKLSNEDQSEVEKIKNYPENLVKRVNTALRAMKSSPALARDAAKDVAMLTQEIALKDVAGLSRVKLLRILGMKFKNLIYKIVDG